MSAEHQPLPEELAALERALVESSSTEPPAELRGRVLAATSGALGRSPNGVMGRPWRWLAVAAAVLVWLNF
jgi:hypothetical protein